MHSRQILYTAVFGLVLSVDSIFAQGNEYFNINPYWQVHKVCAVPYPCIQDETYNYYIGGDTVINSLTYKKVMKQGSGYYSWFGNPPAGCSGTYMYIDTIPWCAVRSVGKQMFVLMPSDTSEQLLFNFNLQVGDTLPISYTTWNNDVFVTAIDSFYTGAGYKKRFALGGNTWATYLLEGVGSDKGLLEPVSVALECDYNLLCYGTNDTAWYPIQGPTCNLQTNANSFAFGKDINVHPNPTHDQLFVSLPTYEKDVTVTLYDQSGRAIYTVKPNSSIFAIPTETRPNGIYILHIASTIFTYHQKIVIQH